MEWQFTVDPQTPACRSCRCNFAIDQNLMQYCSAGTVLTITNSIICVNILFVYFHLFHDRYLSLVAMLTNDEIDNGRLYSRLHKTWCFPLCCCACNCLFSPFRRLVSRSKRRLKVDDFDIDMALITPRIIVHGFPAIGLEHLYRNPRGEILRYLDTYHHDKWKLYNFCCEKGRSYDPAIFHNRVERYPFKDHSTPLLKTMIAFADSAKSWLDGDSERVVSMHCKAGKGRAGLMCCVLLIRTGECQSAAEAMAHYDKTRVKNNKGLTVTSQRKWVMFYEMLWRNYWNAPLGVNIGTMPTEGNGVTYALPEEPILVLTGVEVLNCSCLENITVTVAQGTHFAPVHLCSSIATEKKQTKFLTPCHVKGNFKVSVIHRPGVLRKATKVCDLWHNTLFLDS